MAAETRRVLACGYYAESTMPPRRGRESEVFMKQTDSIEKTAAALTAGKPVVFPTDTVYGIGVAVGLAKTPQVLYDIKRRDSDKAIPWLVGKKSALAFYGCDVPAYALAAAEKFWPGPLTLIVKAASNVPEAFRAENGTIALRMPNDPVALALIERVGFPLATSSANFQGKPPAHTFDEVDRELLGLVAAALGDGSPRSGISSTVVDCTGSRPMVLRHGSVTEKDLFALV